MNMLPVAVVLLLCVFFYFQMTEQWRMGGVEGLFKALTWLMLLVLCSALLVLHIMQQM